MGSGRRTRAVSPAARLPPNQLPISEAIIMRTLKPEFGYSLANIFAEARNVEEFEPDGFSALYDDSRIESIVPEPTAADRRSYSLPMRGDWDDCDGAMEYRDSFWPMMNSLWPVDLAYRRSASEAARLMNLHAGATSLIEIDDQHYIALTGGGMDLSWHIAAAYVCCGCVPPLYILDGLRRSPFRMEDKVNRAILSAGREGAKHLRLRAKQLALNLKSARDA